MLDKKFKKKSSAFFANVMFSDVPFHLKSLSTNMTLLT